MNELSDLSKELFMNSPEIEQKNNCLLRIKAPSLRSSSKTIKGNLKFCQFDEMSNTFFCSSEQSSHIFLFDSKLKFIQEISSQHSKYFRELLVGSFYYVSSSKRVSLTSWQCTIQTIAYLSSINQMNLTSNSQST